MKKHSENGSTNSEIGRRSFLKTSASAVLAGSAVAHSRAFADQGAAPLARKTSEKALFEADRLFSKEEYQARWKQVQSEMKDAGFENVVVWQRSGGTYDKLSDVYWLTNFTLFGTGQGPSSEYNAAPYTFSAVLIRQGKEPEIHIGLRKEWIDLSKVESGKVVSHAPNLMIGFAEYLRMEGIEGRVAVVGADVVPGLYERQLHSRTPQIEWVPEDDLLVMPQRTKSPAELEIYRHAGSLVTEALDSAMEALIDGKRANEAAALAAAALIRGGGGYHRIDITHGGADRPSVLSQGFYGHNTSAPNPGDLVSIWIYGPIYRGYWMDPGRTAICGNRPNADQKSLIGDCAKIVDELVRLMKPGRTFQEVGVLGAKFAEQFGYPRDEPSLFGHSIGTTLGPGVIPNGDYETGNVGLKAMKGMIEPGMVLAAEAFLSREGVGNAGFENNFIITEDGAEVLDKSPMLYW